MAAGVRLLASLVSLASCGLVVGVGGNTPSCVWMRDGVWVGCLWMRCLDGPVWLKTAAATRFGSGWAARWAGGQKRPMPLILGMDGSGWVSDECHVPVA